MDVPVGDKVRVDSAMPASVRRVTRFVKRAFLRGFLGAELCKVQPDSYIAPSFAQSKDIEYLDNGRLWLRQLRDLLGEFGIETSCFGRNTGDTTSAARRYRSPSACWAGETSIRSSRRSVMGFNSERSGRLNALLRWQWTNTTPDHFEHAHRIYQADGEMVSG